MKTALFISILLFSYLSSLSATERWYTIGQNANDVALKEHKLVLTFYKRCNWADQWSDLLMHDACIKLDQEVFSSPEFQEFAQKYLILEVIDYSKGVNTDDKSMQMLHQSLQFWEPQIKTYPTVILHNTDWIQLGRQEGYKTGGAKAFMDWLRKTALTKPVK